VYLIIEKDESGHICYHFFNLNQQQLIKEINNLIMKKLKHPSKLIQINKRISAN
jgi:hypothetical protein